MKRGRVTVATPEPGALPPALDLELGGNCARVPDRAVLLHELRTWLELVERASGHPAALYATHEAYDAYLDGSELAHGIWIRDVWQEPRLPDDKRWLFWQFANRGRVPGVATAVDLDVFAGDRAAFEQLALPAR